MEILKRSHLDIIQWLLAGAIPAGAVAFLNGRSDYFIFAVAGVIIATALYAGRAFITILLTTSPSETPDPRWSLAAANGHSTLFVILVADGIVTGSFLLSLVAGIGALTGAFFSAFIVCHAQLRNDEPLWLLFAESLPLGVGLVVCYSVRPRRDGKKTSL